MDESHIVKTFYTKFNYPSGGDGRSLVWKKRISSLQPKGKKVLDVGCGGGKITKVWKKLGANVVGLDITEVKIRGIEVYHGNVKNMPFKDNLFDVVSCIGVLHHMDDIHSGIRECKRVLKRNGKMILLLYKKNTFYHLLYFLLNPFFKGKDPKKFPKIFFYFIKILFQFHFREKVPDEQITCFLADQIYHPVVRFYSENDIKELAGNFALNINQIKEINYRQHLWIEMVSQKGDMIV